MQETLEDLLHSDLAFIPDLKLRRLTKETIRSLFAAQDILNRLIDEMREEDLRRLQQNPTVEVQQPMSLPKYQDTSTIPNPWKDGGVPEGTVEERFERAWNTPSQPEQKKGGSDAPNNPHGSTDQQADCGLLWSQTYPHFSQ